MRRLLDVLYLAAGVLAGVFMVGVLVCISLAILTRQLAIHVPGLDAFAGYCMAAAGFLALAHTFQKGEHIRVTLLLASLPPRGRHALELASLIAAAVIAANLAWFSCKLVIDSHAYNDISTGEDATPLWIPQLSMAIGCVLFTLSLLDATWHRLRGISPEEEAHEGSQHE